LWAATNIDHDSAIPGDGRIKANMPSTISREVRSTMLAQDATSNFVGVKRERGRTLLVLGGEWTLENAAAIERQIDEALRQIGDEDFEVIGDDIGKLDTSGAFLLKKVTKERAAQAQLRAELRAILEFLPDYSEYTPPKREKKPAVPLVFTNIGKRTFAALDFLWEIFAFIGRVALCFVSALLHPHRFRLTSIVRHIDETGLRALPIIGLLAILITMVITYQGAIQLRTLGADVYTIDLTVISLLRELGVLVTAIMVAGRSGSAFAAEIGVMQLREEVNALRTIGLSPIEVLVMPRVIALVIVLPLLTFFADVVGLIGGGLMSLSLLNISFLQYLSRVEDVATPTMFFVGMIKAPVFAFAIAVIGCYQGLNVTGSAASVGKRTTLAVVQAIFVVIMADGLFSVAFQMAGI
jgi:phospholipid/cholesterol/gamma-HCH transport system permease protein